jgi:hypothetical protein
MKKLFSSLILAVLLSGCMMPKSVEFGQDKVKAFPVAKASETETQRQAAQRAAVKADETFRAALAERASAQVVKPAAETAVLTDSVSTSLGPPLSPASTNLPSTKLAEKLDTATARLNGRIEDFKADNNENAGKKIEGTGFIQMGYFSYLAIFGVFLVLAWVGFRIFMTMLKISNPAIGAGLNVVGGIGGALASKATSQMFQGGERFKAWLKDMKGVDDNLKAQIEELFHDAHKTEQDSDVKALVNKLLGK